MCYQYRHIHKIDDQIFHGGDFTTLNFPIPFPFSRLYNVENSEAVSLGAFPVGRQPQGFIGGTKSSFLEALGDTAVDFDFGAPEVKEEEDVLIAQQTRTTILMRNPDGDSANQQKSGLVVIKSGSTTVVRGNGVSEKRRFECRLIFQLQM